MNYVNYVKDVHSWQFHINLALTNFWRRQINKKIKMKR
uniref:Uncharacterized protein n=1 Tax=Anguilla anguilla TaxID=7936 RepID=A0A0E9QQ81_ANGAN